MSKFTAEEINGRINDLEIDEDVKISLMEDITDSFEVNNEDELNGLKSELDSTKEKYEDLKEKYKERFLNPVEFKEEKVDDKKDLDEKIVIDIREI